MSEQIKYMTCDEILSSVDNVVYYREVLKDLQNNRFDWIVTLQVLDYAVGFRTSQIDYVPKIGKTIKNLPELTIKNNSLTDGSRRISAIYILQKFLDVRNPLWSELKFKIRIT